MIKQHAGVADEIALKCLPQSNAPQQLCTLFPGSTPVLDALTIALTEDRSRSFLTRVVRGEKESFLLSTPRHRIRFFEDRYDSTIAILLTVEANSFFQWNEDKRKGIPFSASWTSRASARSSSSQFPQFESLRKSKSGPISARYWDFWSGLLDQEQEGLEDLKNHPGWSYSMRRPSLRGGIEFQVGDDRDSILQACGNSFLVQSANVNSKKGNGLREKSMVFDAQRSETNRWLSGANQRDVDLGSVPKSGTIRINWIGTAAELKRKRESLDRLKAGTAALAGLDKLLPDGPSDSLPIPEFTRILSTEYNDEQICAIRKALVPNSLTSILGPPGTGKTSVIAEIAAQYASEGKRVLISSQSNLAVDNALEKVTGVSQIFAVRIGRPESVKLNPDLLLERASLRYRDRLLDRSAVAQDEMQRSVSEQQDWLPEEGTLCSWIDGWVDHRRMKHREFETRTRFENAKQASDHAALEMATAERRIQSLCALAKLSLTDCDRFLNAGRTLLMSGITADLAYLNRAKIALTVKHRDDIARMIQLSSEIPSLNDSIAAIRTSIGTFQNQISDWHLAEDYLYKARTENNAFERKKSSAGFLEKLWMNITGPPHDVAKAERNFSQATRLRDSAAQQLPEAQKALTPLIQNVASKIAERILLAQKTFGSTQEISPALVDAWKRDLEMAEKVQRAGALEFTPLFDRYSEFEVAMESLKRATSSSQRTKAEEQTANVAWEEAIADLNVCNDFHDELKSFVERLGNVKPNNLNLDSDSMGEKDTEVFFAALKTRRESLALQIRSWPEICTALDVYRSRLNQPIVDLQRAVINDSNVIGATCSGIAGSRDFESDFDCVILDEAGRTTPLDLIMPVVRGKTIVLVGDHKQLPPFIGESVKAELSDPEKELLDRSIFEGIYETSHPDRRQALQTQYRMVKPICDVVREISYTDATINLECTEFLKSHRHSFPGLLAIHWIRPTGSNNVAMESGGRGLINYAEVEATLDILDRLASHKSGSVEYSIGVISMYKQQALEIERRLHSSTRNYEGVHIEVGTVDSFQGREKDAVILSFAETDPKRRRFFYDRRRLNVSISRARELLVIVGSLDKLGSSRRVFGIDNPLFELRSMLEDGQGYCYSKEDFGA
jgi:hypothetical protein